MIRGNISDILKDGGKKIILNLADVPNINSAGIGELVSTYATVADMGGRPKLPKLTKKGFANLCRF